MIFLTEIPASKPGFLLIEALFSLVLLCSVTLVFGWYIQSITRYTLSDTKMAQALDFAETLCTKYIVEKAAISMLDNNTQFHASITKEPVAIKSINSPLKIKPCSLANVAISWKEENADKNLVIPIIITESLVI